jgi:Tol biopolymer transport system component
MHDPLTFERRLADAYSRYVEPARVTVDAAAVTRSIVERAQRRPASRGYFGGRASALVRALVAVGLVVLAIAGLLLASGAWREARVQNGPILLWDGASFLAIEMDGRQTPIPIPGSHDRSCPTFAPDGRTFAFLRNDPGGDDGQLAVADADGTNVRLLWTGRFNGQTFHQMVWSADGSTVVATKALDAGGDGIVVVARPADGTATTLDLPGGEFPATIAVSPDGRRIAAPAAASIEVVDVATGSSTTLVDGGMLAIAWSPTNETLAYLAGGSESDERTVRFVRPDGTADRPIPVALAGSAMAPYLAWSRDGRLLAVLEHDDGIEAFFIRLIDAEGSVVGRLGPFRSPAALSFTWAPDGHSLVLTGAGGSGVFDQQPIFANLDGTSEVLEVPAGYYAQCPLGWAPARE